LGSFGAWFFEIFFWIVILYLINSLQRFFSHSVVVSLFW
jgi:hypothetical protein